MPEAEQQKLDPPRGMFNARSDDRGRVKFPVNFQEYLRSLSDKRVFVTSLDRYVARVYPISVWRENEAFFDTHRDDDSERAYFNAMELGEESELDSQGRIGLSTDLRRELDLVDQPVKIFVRDGVVNIISEARFVEQQADAKALTKEGLSKLRQAGLK